VEDDESLAELLRKALTSQHYLVDLAIDGQVGWELTEAFEYDLILLDLLLPKLDGISFAGNDGIRAIALNSATDCSGR
jgi:DNA-binding response OmpR family regulator